MAASISSGVTGAAGCGTMPFSWVTGAVTGVTRRPALSHHEVDLVAGLEMERVPNRFGQGHPSLAGDRRLHYMAPLPDNRQHGAGIAVNTLVNAGS